MNPPPELPDTLTRLLRDSHWQADTLGESMAKAYRIVGETGNFYLKTCPVEPLSGLQAEADALIWLRQHLPAPEVVYVERTNGTDYLLMREVPGLPASDGHWHQNPHRLAERLAEAMLYLHRLPIESCPFDQRLNTKLSDVALNVQLGLIDEDDFDDDNFGRPPAEILEQLRRERPAQEELVVTHGDFCLPNILFTEQQLSGFIDVGKLGIADRYQDLAVCAGCLADCLETDRYNAMFFAAYGLSDIDEHKLRYYRLLNELL